MKEIVGSNIEKINPMKVLTYDEAHEDVSKAHCKAHKKMSSMDTKFVSGVIERVEKETKKMVRK